MPWRKHNKLTLNETAGIVAAALAVARRVCIFHETLILRLSEIRLIPWFLTEGEIEVRVDPSTWTNLNKVEPGTNDRECLSSLAVLHSYVRISLFVHHLICFINGSGGITWIFPRATKEEAKNVPCFRRNGIAPLIHTVRMIALLFILISTRGTATAPPVALALRCPLEYVSIRSVSFQFFFYLKN